MSQFPLVCVALVGCSGGKSLVPVDAPWVADARAIYPADADIMVRVVGQVLYNGPVQGATARLTYVDGYFQDAHTDENGEFFADVPKGMRLVIKVTTFPAGPYPMIRSYVADDNRRLRNFYLLGPIDRELAMATLGVDFDPAKAVVEVDFRNSTVGGYGATMRDPDGEVIPPGFGIAYDVEGLPQLSLQTVAGGDGSTLLFADVPPGIIALSPSVPDGGTLPCQPCDSEPLPIEAGVVTWFDFECGSATDCL